jgi:NAD(P)H-dependent flavin oxidoreductase YrpB (nitropropane dioxygenase family)
MLAGMGGVSYSALCAAVSEAGGIGCLGASTMIMQGQMEAEIAKVRRTKSAEDAARATLRAVGTGYLRFAFTETGLFRTAFANAEPLGFTRDPARKGKSGLDPLELLGAALDKLVATALLPAERRPGAEFLAWSSVHGFAMLVIDGPLQAVPRADVDRIGARVIAMVEKGL